MPRKVITRCVPAGMSINLVEDIRDELLEECSTSQITMKTEKEKNLNPLPISQVSSTNDAQLFHQVQSTQTEVNYVQEQTKNLCLQSSSSHRGESETSETQILQLLEVSGVPYKIKPPRTISPKNTWISRTDSPITYNENAGFFDDIKNLKIVGDFCRSLSNVNTAPDSVYEHNEGYNSSRKEEFLKKIHESKLKKRHSSVTEKTVGSDNSMSSEINASENEVQVTFVDRYRHKIQKNIEKIKNKKNRRTEDLSIPNVQDDECKCDKLIDCPVWCARNIFKGSESDGINKSHPFLQDILKQTEITKIVNNKTILHGFMFPKPIFSVDDTYMDNTIQKILKSMNCTSTKDIQSYMWPAVQRGLNVFMIGPSGTGKTLAYLPFFCSFIIDKNEKHLDLLKYEGPFIIIFCMDIKKCEALQNLVKSLTSNSCNSVVVEVATDDTGPQTTNCDILITTPSVLKKCLVSETVKLKRLCHVAIEDAHVVLKNYSQSMGKLLNIMNELRINRPQNKNIQVIVSSEKWSCDIETILKKLYVPPLVCFEDFLEGAIYSKTIFTKKKLKSTHKVLYLIDILKLNFMSTKTVVFCNDNEIGTVCELLVVNGVECITISDNLMEDEIFENEDMWRSLQSGTYKVLLITDALFEKTQNVRNAQWLIHFNLPKDWVQLSKRFRCLSANFHSPLTIHENPTQVKSLKTLLIIDEFCDSHLLDFFDLLTRNSITRLQI